jgi:hypothetical protein
MTDLGRTTRCYVSGYNRTRVHATRMFLGESRQLVADFNGAIPKGSLIVSATWKLELGGVVSISNAAIATDQRSTSVQCTTIFEGCIAMRCIATLDDGSTLTQQFGIAVPCAPYYGDPVGAQGALELTVSV